MIHKIPQAMWFSSGDVRQDGDIRLGAVARGKLLEGRLDRSSPQRTTSKHRGSTSKLQSSRNA